MTEQNTTDAPVTDTTEQAITPEQYQALQEEVERMRKHNETLLAEKKAETDKRKAEQAEKDRLAEEQARKKGDIEQLEQQYKDKIASLEAEIAERDKQRDIDMVQSTAFKIASSLSDNPNNQEVLQMLIEKRLVAENGQVKVTDSSGNLSIASLDEFANELKTSGKYDALITGTKASGTGATGQATNSGKTQADFPDEKSRMELLQTNPTLFNQLFT